MKQKFRAWHKTWEEMGKVKRIRFDDEGNVTTVLFEGKILGVNTHADEIELMKSTDLFDRNGQEIFEGDILKNSKYITSVFYERGAYCVKFRQTPNTTVTMNVISFIEKYKTKVIGNIYENKGILEEEE
jgi:hypothetical protein